MIRPSPLLDASLVEEGSIVSAGILRLVQFMDEQWGAAEWGTRQVGVGTVVVLGIIRFTWKDAYGVTWYQFVHAILSGYLSFLAVWLNFFEAETLTGTSEPLRSFLCQGPLTSLHRILPAITMGFGFFDILDGIGHGFDFVRDEGGFVDFFFSFWAHNPDFLFFYTLLYTHAQMLHGVATFTVMAYFCEYQIGELILPMLLMEVRRIVFLPTHTRTSSHMGGMIDTHPTLSHPLLH